MPRAPSTKRRAAADETPDWTFLTNHATVLLGIASSRGATVEAVARQVGITERSARRIIADLEADGYLSRQRVGRRNTYRIDNARPLRHPIVQHRAVATLLALVSPSRTRRR
jgi:predicted ArsR family transcriptional regulator